ncbi:MAG: imidazole glycerol phosphate synthase subunit HisF [Bacteroidota bacterium]
MSDHGPRITDHNSASPTRSPLPRGEGQGEGENSPVRLGDDSSRLGANDTRHSTEAETTASLQSPVPDPQSLKRRVIPCLDVKDGRVVKGVHFVGLRDMGDPVELAARYEREGADEIVFLDIAASAENRATALDMVRRTASALSIPFTLGGGLRTLDDVYAFLDAGADKVALNTRAVQEPDLVDACAERFGSQCVVVAVDVKPIEGSASVGSAPRRQPPTRSPLPSGEGHTDSRRLGTEADPSTPHSPRPRYGVFTHGGQRPTDLDGAAWAAELADRGAGEILLTCIHRDGTGDGFDTAFTGALARTLPCQVIASGGAATPQHLLDAFEAGADAVLAATMFHSGAYEIASVKRFLADRGIPVRLSQ